MKIKICGNRYADQARQVAALRPDFMGWIFAPESPRRISCQDASRIIDGIRRRYPAILHVAVFAGNRFQEIDQVEHKIQADLLQVIGDLPLLQNCWRRFGRRLLPAVRMGREENAIGNAPGSLVIADSFVPGKKGGTGKRFAPELLEGFSRPFLLAGGLTADNVQKALEETAILSPGLCGADVSSGIEDAPGYKNPAKLASFIKQVRMFS
ncbi:MAG: phosphoribosylanthranilate isomerase [Spirochaetales bacterium]|nr:phosphoribosylanthranilate isomerase [Spirochaetales bacterium]